MPTAAPRAAPGAILISPEVRHLKALDGLRGLAISLVLLTHCFECNTLNQGWLIRVLGSVLDCGRFGVDLFFVLSGFLITGILIDTRDDPHFFRNFFGRRALRILPLYYGVLGVLLALSVPFHWQWHGMALLLLTYLQNLRPGAIDAMAVGPGIGLFHFWSLAIEEQFYFLWPPLVYLLAKRRGGVFWAALLGAASVLLLRVMLVLRGVSYLAIHLTLPTRADSLLIGALLAVGYRHRQAWAVLQRLSPAFFTILATVLFGGILWSNVNAGPRLWILGFRYTLLALCFAALLVWSLQPAGRVKELFEQGWLCTLGKYSYGLYVLHVIVVSLLRLPLREALQRSTGSRALAVSVTGVVSIAASLLAAYSSFHLYESQFLRLKRHFRYAVVNGIPR